MLTKCFSYLRVSSKGQADEDKDGIPRQQEAVAKYAQSNGLEIVREYVDEITGTTEQVDRPGLNEMFLALEGNGVRVVLVENASRLARRVLVSEVLIRQLQKLGVKLLSVDGGLDLTAGSDDAPEAKLIRQIMAVIAEFEKCQHVRRMRLAREKVRAKGERCEGRKPYGVTEEQQRIMGLIKAWRQERKTIKEIAAELNAAGFKARTGGVWHATQVRRVLGV